ncbi:MAG: hypothetical protein ACHQKY_18055, partial [Terriglobia bacterium]
CRSVRYGGRPPEFGCDQRRVGRLRGRSLCPYTVFDFLPNGTKQIPPTAVGGSFSSNLQTRPTPALQIPLTAVGAGWRMHGVLVRRDGSLL